MFAASTSVSIEKSLREIRDLVLDHGGQAFATAEDEERVCIQFLMQERRIMFELQMPVLASFLQEQRNVRGGKTITRDVAPATAAQRHTQACRAAWRALALTIKAKFVAVEDHVETFEEAFLAHVVVPGKNGRSERFIKAASKMLADSYMGKPLPPLLPG